MKPAWKVMCVVAAFAAASASVPPADVGDPESASGSGVRSALGAGASIASGGSSNRSNYSRRFV
jgi:hypothetical protein